MTLAAVNISVLKTLKYCDHFSYPLTPKEIHLRLCSSEPCSLERVFTTLKSMIKKGVISQTGVYYHLPKRSSIVALRQARFAHSSKQLVRAHRLATQLSHVPHVLAIYLTGSLAMRNSGPDSDIDFMIVAKDGKLWTTRLLLTLYTTLLGLRRTPGSQANAGKLCLNLYLTPTSYPLPLHKQSLYTAYELVQAVPVYDPSSTRAMLLSANPWIKRYLPHVLSKTDLTSKPASSLEHRKTGILEHLLFYLQYYYMKPKLTREYITINSAFFHPHDPSPRV